MFENPPPASVTAVHAYIVLLTQRFMFVCVCCRSQLLDVWGGPEWQGFAGSDCQVPSDEQLLRPLSGAKGLLVLGPGRLLGHVGTQVSNTNIVTCAGVEALQHL